METLIKVVFGEKIPYIPFFSPKTRLMQRIPMKNVCQNS